MTPPVTRGSLTGQRQRQQVTDDRRLAVGRSTNDLHQILAALIEPRRPGASCLPRAIKERVTAPPRDAQREASCRKASDGRLKANPCTSDHDVSVSARFSDPPRQFHFPSSRVECDRARSQARRRIAKRAHSRDLVLASRSLGDDAAVGERHDTPSEEQRVFWPLPCGRFAALDDRAAQVRCEYHVVHVRERGAILHVDGKRSLPH